VLRVTLLQCLNDVSKVEEWNCRSWVKYSSNLSEILCPEMFAIFCSGELVCRAQYGKMESLEYLILTMLNFWSIATEFYLGTTSLEAYLQSLGIFQLLPPFTWPETDYLGPSPLLWEILPHWKNCKPRHPWTPFNSPWLLTTYYFVAPTNKHFQS